MSAAQAEADRIAPYILESVLPLEMMFAVALGLAFGSFLNVCIVRLPRGESIVLPASRCFSCGQPLRTVDNVPLLSWMWLQTRSRCCRQPIPWRYPLVEAFTAALFLGCLIAFGLNINGIGFALFCWLLLGLAWMDAETFLLPDAFTLPGIALGILFHGLSAWATTKSVRAGLVESLLEALLSAALFGGLLLAIALLYRIVRRREGMGMGDLKLAAMLGAWLGWQLSAVVFLVAVLAGAAAGIVLSLRRSSSKRSQKHEGQAAEEPLRLPFGTFLAAAGILVVFTGKALLAWYLRFF